FNRRSWMVPKGEEQLLQIDRLKTIIKTHFYNKTINNCCFIIKVFLALQCFLPKKNLNMKINPIAFAVMMVLSLAFVGKTGFVVADLYFADKPLFYTMQNCSDTTLRVGI